MSYYNISWTTQIFLGISTMLAMAPTRYEQRPTSQVDYEWCMRINHILFCDADCAQGRKQRSRLQEVPSYTCHNRIQAVQLVARGTKSHMLQYNPGGQLNILSPTITSLSGQKRQSNIVDHACYQVQHIFHGTRICYLVFQLCWQWQPLGYE